MEAASKERNDAITERNDAQRAWGEMVMKHERAIKANLDLQAEFSKAFKDLPWLEQKTFELAEQNTIQYNEIEQLKLFKLKYDELLHQVCIHGSYFPSPLHLCPARSGALRHCLGAPVPPPKRKY